MKVYNSKSVRNIVMAGWLVLMALGLIVVPSAAHAQVDNLMYNPSFEEDEVILDDPTWTSWATWGWENGTNSTVALDNTEFIDGTRSLRIMPIGPDNWHFILLHMNISMQVDTEYTASFWAKAEAPRPLAAQFKAVDNVSGVWGYKEFQLTTEWAEYSMTSAALNGDVKLEFFCAGSEVPFWLDFVYVYEGDYVAGIKPSATVPEHFHIVDFQPVTGGWSLTWESAVGQPATYTVQRQTNLALAWDTLAEDISSQGTTTSYTDTDTPATTAFYRVLKTPPPPPVYTKLQILMPGETAAPGTPTGKTGTPDPQTVALPFSITVNAVDNDWNRVSGIANTIRITTSDPIWEGGPMVSPNPVLSNGRVVVSDLKFWNQGTFTITVEDVTDPSKGSDTSSPTAANW
jgi:hypothetical protein